jgi:hypothetical protein
MIHQRTLILFLFGAAMVLFAVQSLRGQRLKERYALLMLFSGLPFLVLAVWPDGIVFLCEVLDIEKPTTMVLCLGVFTLVMLFKLLSIVSVQERRIVSLAQTIGILMAERGAGDDGPAAADPAQGPPGSR